MMHKLKSLALGIGLTVTTISPLKAAVYFGNLLPSPDDLNELASTMEMPFRHKDPTDFTFGLDETRIFFEDNTKGPQPISPPVLPPEENLSSLISDTFETPPSADKMVIFNRNVLDVIVRLKAIEEVEARNARVSQLQQVISHWHGAAHQPLAEQLKQYLSAYFLDEGEEKNYALNQLSEKGFVPAQHSFATSVLTMYVNNQLEKAQQARKDFKDDREALWKQRHENALLTDEGEIDKLQKAINTLHDLGLKGYADYSHFNLAWACRNINSCNLSSPEDFNPALDVDNFSNAHRNVYAAQIIYGAHSHKKRPENLDKLIPHLGMNMRGYYELGLRGRKQSIEENIGVFKRQYIFYVHYFQKYLPDYL